MERDPLDATLCPLKGRLGLMFRDLVHEYRFVGSYKRIARTLVDRITSQSTTDPTHRPWRRSQSSLPCGAK